MKATLGPRARICPASPVFLRHFRSKFRLLQHPWEVPRIERHLSNLYVDHSSTFSPCLVRVFGQIHQQLEKLIRLTNEEPHGCKKIDHSHGDSLRLGRTNDRTLGELAAKERTGFRHDQVGLKRLPAKRGCVEVGKGQSVRRVRQGRRIARLVRPGLECMVSVGPMLMRIRKTSTLVALCAIDG
jgi:hypothetical protein